MATASHQPLTRPAPMKARQRLNAAMNYNHADILWLLEQEGYSCRLESGYVHVIGRSGREVVRIPLSELEDRGGEAAAPCPPESVALLPADILGWRD